MKSALKTLAFTLSLAAATFGTSFAKTDGSTGTNALTLAITKGKTVSPGNLLTASIVAPTASAATAIVTDSEGREIWRSPLDLNQGQNEVRFRVQELNSGLYFIQVKSGEHTQTRTFYVH